MIPLAELKVGTVYKLNSRNLDFGVFTGRGFIGIRTKFGNRYLFEEYERSTSDHFGTATALEVIGLISGCVVIKESLGTQCGVCSKAVNFDDRRAQGYRWQHDDKSTHVEAIDPVSIGNEALLKALEEFK